MRQYADAVSRKIRKDKIDKIKTEEVKETVEKLTKLINEHVPEAEREKEKVTAYVLTQIQSRIAFDDVETGILKLMGDDLSPVKLRPVSEVTNETKVGKKGEVLDKEVRIGNDSDAAYLMYYYYYLLQQQSKAWNQIVDLVAELRFEECEDMADFAEENGEVSSSDYHFDDIRAVVLKAQMRLFAQHVKKLESEEKKPSPEQLRAVKELLRQHGYDKG